MTDNAGLGIIQTSNVIVTHSPVITTTSVQLAGDNKSRVAFFIWNNSSNSIYLTFGTSSSSASPTLILASFSTYSSGAVVYTGPISAIRNVGTGNCTMYELIR